MTVPVPNINDDFENKNHIQYYKGKKYTGTIVSKLGPNTVATEYKNGVPIPGSGGIWNAQGVRGKWNDSIKKFEWTGKPEKFDEPPMELNTSISGAIKSNKKSTPKPSATPTVKPSATPTPTPTSSKKDKPAATPTPTGSPSANVTPPADSGLGSFLSNLGIDPSTIQYTAGGTDSTPAKNGTFTRTYTSANIPNDLALKDSVNKIYKEYYGRDAQEAELATWIPFLKSKYTSKDGKTKSTVKEVYKNGELVSTDYLTADGSDPKLILQDKIKTNLLSGKQQINEASIPEGPSGDYFVKIKNFAARNGIKLSDEAATSYANQIVAGAMDENTVTNTLRESAANAFPSLADKIQQGIDLKTLADPYIQSMSDILELPATSLDVFDPSIRKALAYTLPDGKVGTKSIYDFERELRKDARWQYTNKAREEVASATSQVLKDFGLRG